ncbi:MAG: FAD-binding protein [Bdellovibrionota bacterium]
MSPTTDHLRRLPELHPEAGYRENVSARTLTTFGLGGAVKSLYEPRTLDALRALLVALFDDGLSYRTLGAGSNLVFSDNGISEPVIRLGRSFSGFTLIGESDPTPSSVEQLFHHVLHPSQIDSSAAAVRCLALAGAPLMSLSREVTNRGYSGLEFGAGIPASIGGAVVMNAGAHGSQFSDVVTKVFAVDRNGSDLILTKEQLNYSYRHSELPPGTLVLGVELLLRAEDLEIVRKRRADCLAYRKETQPLSLPSAGSAFRNPSRGDLPHDTMDAPRAAAQLLEQVGLKGARKGGVAYSELHANWLVRVSDDARSEDARDLLQLGISKVQAEHSVTLRPEIVWWE